MDTQQIQNPFTLRYRTLPDFLKRQLSQEIQIKQTPFLNVNDYEEELRPVVEKINAILQDLNRREENVRAGTSTNQDILRRNTEQALLAAEQTRDARREALRQANQELQLQNRLRMRAMGGNPGTAIIEMQNRADRATLGKIAEVDDDYFNRVSDVETKALEQIGKLESQLRDVLADIEKERTASLRELDLMRTQLKQLKEAQEAAARARGGGRGDGIDYGLLAALLGGGAQDAQYTPPLQSQPMQSQPERLYSTPVSRRTDDLIIKVPSDSVSVRGQGVGNVLGASTALASYNPTVLVGNKMAPANTLPITPLVPPASTAVTREIAPGVKVTSQTPATKIGSMLTNSVTPTSSSSSVRGGFTPAPNMSLPKGMTLEEYIKRQSMRR